MAARDRERGSRRFTFTLAPIVLRYRILPQALVRTVYLLRKNLWHILIRNYFDMSITFF